MKTKQNLRWNKKKPNITDWNAIVHRKILSAFEEMCVMHRERKKERKIEIEQTFEMEQSTEDRKKDRNQSMQAKRERESDPNIKHWTT